MGVDIAEVTLHVGLGTFRPVKVENVLDHHMHSEFYMVSQEAADKINRAKESGYSYREPVTFETLNEMIGYRLMNNESLMNAFPDDAAQMEACRKENAATDGWI